MSGPDLTTHMSSHDKDRSWPVAEVRRQEIVRLLLERETVTVRELCDRFGVSAMTVHRDLDALQARGVLRKVHGGATAQPSSSYESSLRFRQAAGVDAKRAIAARAIRQVTPGSSVLLDDSTTALAMVPLLAQIPQLTIVTNFLAVVEAYSSMDGQAELLVTGGLYDERYHSLLGIVTEQALSEVRVDRAFISVPAVDLKDGVFHQEAVQARVKRAMISIADEVVLLADSSKLDKRALHWIAGLDAFDVIIVDESADAAAVEALRSNGVQVDVAVDETAKEASASRVRNGAEGSEQAEGAVG
jgi:DeoR/GlpR family transcriptional regulator of sugar metabolism